MPVIDICVSELPRLSERCVVFDFPLERFGEKMEKLGKDYLRQTHNTQQGLTWGEALLNIPDEMWEKHGFQKPTSDWDYVCAIQIYEPEYAYVVPSKEALLMEASAQMTMYLLDYLDAEILEQNAEKVREKISEFVLIWAPRFVDFGEKDIGRFTKKALAQEPKFDWEVFEEEEEFDPDEYGCESQYAQVVSKL